jgi:hypothetical protein
MIRRSLWVGFAGFYVWVSGWAQQATMPPQAAVFAKFGPKVTVRSDADFLYIEGDGMPAHPMMKGITSWQQQVPLPQKYTGPNAWRIPLRPVPAKEAKGIRDRFLRGAIAIAANGIPIFNPQNNRGEVSAEIGELDEWGGHCGRADDYHYHVVPLHLESVVGRGQPLAYALDGYPIYGVTEPDGSAPVGLDSLNGHEGGGIGYHYHASRNYPYGNGGFHGEVVERDGQVDPQPRAMPVRPSLTALRGAKITDFRQASTGRFELEYDLNGEKRAVLYEVRADGSVPFEFRNGREGVKREIYGPAERGGGAGGGRPGEKPRGPGGPPAAEPGRGPKREPDVPGTRRKAWFEMHGAELDPDGDGVILRTEVEREIRRVFEGFDRDKDGKLSRSELGSGNGVRSPFAGFLVEHREGMDANGDGALEEAEVLREVLRMFDKQDGNRDGRLAPEEWRDQGAAPEGAKKPGKGGRKP